MEREKCYDLAEQFGLDVASVTSSTNGYPQNVQLALVGFDNFEQAEDVANANNLTIVLLFKRDGQDLWKKLNIARGPINLKAKYNRDDYMSFDSSWNERDFTDNIRGAIDGTTNLDEIFDIIDFFKILKGELDDISEDEQVIARMYDASSIEVTKKEVMRYHDYANSSTITIAVI